jgi:hypothetical protein
MRIIKYNGLVFGGFLLVWLGIVAVEAKLGRFTFLKYLFFLSIPLALLAFFLATRSALPRSDGAGRQTLKALLIAVVITPILVFVGVTLAVNFKLLIGGRL